jgi:CHAT domain-containing protein
MMRKFVRGRLPGLASLLVALLFSGLSIPALAQTGQEIPNTQYWLAKSAYYDGDFATARKAFQDAARGGIKSADGRWVDSICYHVMLGECMYEMGNLTQALDQYASALQLYLVYQNWMLQVEFPAALDVETRLPKIIWGTPTRTTRIGKYPDRYPIIQNTATVVGDLGGKNAQLVSGMQATMIGAQEIARCTALAIRRRREIMGPTCVHDRLTDQIVAALTRRPAPPNSWSQSWVSVQLGLAYSSAGKQELAIAELSKGLQAGGTFDHLMTSLALLELGDIHFQQGKYDTAGVFYLEATYSAAMFGNYDDMEAGFRGAQLCWLLVGKNQVFLPVSNAIAWAGNEKVRKLEVALRLLAAENLTLVGDAGDAATLLATAQKAMYKKEMLLARPGARWNFEMARIAFAGGDTADGAANLAVAMKFQQASSRWLFQIGLADALVTGNALSEREADTLYADLLRDPTARDWSIDPLESLTVASTSFAAALEHWFEIALRRKEPEKAMEIADRLRRHRFYSTLPLGGRLLALRWILAAPKDALNAKALLQRQDLLNKYPNYDQASLRVTTLQQELDKLPLLPTDEEERKKQAGLLAELAKISALQEVILRNIALRREPSDYVFPPDLDVKQLQKALPERTLVLAYINISGKLMGFALGREKYATFPVATALQVKNDLAGMYKAWGLREKNQLVDAKDLMNESWRSTARRLLKSLTNNIKDENWANFDEVVIVPDSVLWYVPFEALPVSDEDDAQPLIEKVRIRYVPTLALALPDSVPKPKADRIGVVAGKLFPRDDMAISAGEYEKIASAVPSAASLTNKLPVVSSLFASQLDQLVVYHDLDEANVRGGGPYDWSPLPVDRAKTASFLGEWISLPWDAPRQVVLPGFHTWVESGLRKGGTGDELFLTSCAFMASGAKTVLLSRWRSGGQTSYDLAREFALEAPHTSASQAWQRSVHLGMHAPIDFLREPRLKASEDLDGLDASHPFFWSGYLLIDTGSEPKSDKPKVEVAKPAIKEDAGAKKPDAEKKPDADKKPEAEKKPGEEKMPEDKPAKADEVDGKLPPDLEALRKERPAKEKPVAKEDVKKAEDSRPEPLKPRSGKKAAPKRAKAKEM